MMTVDYNKNITVLNTPKVDCEEVFLITLKIQKNTTDKQKKKANDFIVK
jgi:hypothetical protein